MMLGFYSIRQYKARTNFNGKAMRYKYRSYYERRFFYDKEFRSFINSEIAHRHIEDFDRIAFLCLKLECLDNSQIDSLRYFKEIVTLTWNIREDWANCSLVHTDKWGLWGSYLSEVNIHKKLVKEWSPIFKEKYGFGRSLMMWDVDKIGSTITSLLTYDSKRRMYIELHDYKI